jgi:predicted glycoside hydrolase/deacetylase ChbG (UPF0249 family)
VRLSGLGNSLSPRLIVNADDFGRSPAISRGILEGIRRGIVTAASVLSTGPGFEEQVGWLREIETVDSGTHLSLTFGAPLTTRMRDLLSPDGGYFPETIGGLARLAVSGRLSLAAVEDEWDAQVNRCLAAGLSVRFLNSHHHIHMWPSLFSVARRVADRHGIAHLRRPGGERPGTSDLSGEARNLILRVLGMRLGRESKEPRLLGITVSGRLDLAYLETALKRLEPGGVYELVCHPGFRDPAEAFPPAVLAFHRWEQELEVLTGSGVRNLCDFHRVRLCGYRDLDKGEGEA